MKKIFLSHSIIPLPRIFVASCCILSQSLFTGSVIAQDNLSSAAIAPMSAKLYAQQSVPTSSNSFSATVITDAEAKLNIKAGIVDADLKSVDAKKVRSVDDQYLAVLPNSDMFVYVLDQSLGSNLGFPVLGSVTGDKHTFYIVQEYAIYRNLPDDLSKQLQLGTSNDLGAKGAPTAQGISIRMIISIKTKDLSIAGLSIGAITAAAQSKNLTANISLQTVGLIGQSITAATPMPSELNFTTLSAMYRGMDDIKKAIWGETNDASLVFIRPQIIRERLGPQIDQSSPN